MTTSKANIAKTYATVVAQACTPHIQDQKATGTPKGVTVIQRSTKIVNTVKPTTAQSYQGTTGSPTGVVKAPKMQQEDTKAMLCKVLYEIFNVKNTTITPESKDPIKVNAVCFKGRYSLATQVNHIFYKNTTRSHDTGHTQALSLNKLMRSRECYHCHKKGHYARNCHTRCQTASTSPEAIVIHAMRSCPDMGILPMNQLTKRIQENRRVNSFDTLKEETLDETIPVAAPAPKLLDKRKLEELVAAYQAKQSPAHAPSPLKVKMVQEFIKDNAHKFDKATHKQLADLCKPKPKSEPSAQQMGDALKNKIPHMDEDTKIRTLNALVPAIGFDIQKIKTLAKTFGIDSTFINRSNSVQIPVTLISYKQESTVIALLDTGATENFIDNEAVNRLCLETKDLPYKCVAYNVDGTINQHGCITKYCNLLISKGNTKRQQWFYITNLGRECFLLGYPWFKAFKPNIDWEQGTLKGPKVKAEISWKVTWDKAQSYLKDK